MCRRLIIVIIAGTLAFTAACSKQDGAPSAGNTVSPQDSGMAAEADTSGSAASTAGAPREEADSASSGLRKEPGRDKPAAGTEEEKPDGQDPAPDKTSRKQGDASREQEQTSQKPDRTSREQEKASQKPGQAPQEQKKASPEPEKAEGSGGPAPEEAVIPDEDRNDQHTQTPSSAEYDAGTQEDGGSSNEGEEVPLD